MSDAAAKRRARQTLINLLLSLAATLGIMLMLILAVPRDDSSRLQPIDYADLAAQASSSAPGALLVPDLGEDWYSNAARYRTAEQDGVANWYVGFVGPNGEFLAMTQGLGVNQTWISFQLESTKPVGKIQVAGATWEIYENPRTGSSPKSKDFILMHKYGSDAVLVYGVAPREVMEDFALKLTNLIAEN